MSVDTKYLKYATERYAFPGGYELFFVTDDGGVLCAPCVVQEWSETVFVSDPGDGWYVVAVGHDGELDEPVSCDHCSRVVGQVSE